MNTLMKKLTFFFIIAIVLSGCFCNKSRILDFPSPRQSYDYSCGPGAVQAVMAYYGEDFRESQLIDSLKTDKNDGTLVKEIVKFLSSRGFKTDVKQNLTQKELFGYIDRKIPVIVLIQAWGTESNFNNHYIHCWNDGHFLVVIGYNKKNVIFFDPALFKAGYIPIPEFMDRWHDYDEGETKTFHMGIAVYGKQPNYVQKTFERIK
jgi:predicted double-glycine peptidase